MNANATSHLLLVVVDSFLHLLVDEHGDRRVRGREDDARERSSPQPKEPLGAVDVPQAPRHGRISRRRGTTRRLPSLLLRGGVGAAFLPPIRSSIATRAAAAAAAAVVTVMHALDLQP